MKPEAYQWRSIINEPIGPNLRQIADTVSGCTIEIAGRMDPPRHLRSVMRRFLYLGPRSHSRSREYLRLIASKPRPFARIRLAVARCFMVSDGPITIRQVLERSYPRLRRFTAWHYLAARRALRLSAEVIGRNRYGRGRPNLWMPRDTDAT
jgi:hypothetical protein